MGDWKLVAPKGAPWELYHLRGDRAESNDLSQRYPDMARALENRWELRSSEFRKLALEGLPK